MNAACCQFSYLCAVVLTCFAVLQVIRWRHILYTMALDIARTSELSALLTWNAHKSADTSDHSEHPTLGNSVCFTQLLPMKITFYINSIDITYSFKTECKFWSLWNYTFKILPVILFVFLLSYFSTRWNEYFACVSLLSNSRVQLSYQQVSFYGLSEHLSLSVCGLCYIKF